CRRNQLPHGSVFALPSTQVRAASADCPAAHETGRVGYGRKPDRGIRETGRSVSSPVSKAGHRLRECRAVECGAHIRWRPFHGSRTPCLCRGTLCVPDEISKTRSLHGSWSISIPPAPAPAAFRSALRGQTLTARGHGTGNTLG